jgi:hypothetical protein
LIKLSSRLAKKEMCILPVLYPIRGLSGNPVGAL